MKKLILVLAAALALSLLGSCAKPLPEEPVQADPEPEAPEEPEQTDEPQDAPEEPGDPDEPQEPGASEPTEDPFPDGTVWEEPDTDQKGT